MTPRVTGTRMHKARTVWRHYFFQACASFALYQVDCPAADKRAARAGSAVISTLVLADVSLRTKLRTGGVWPFLHTAKSVSQRRVRSMRGHGTAETGWATKMAAQQLAPGHCSLCTRAVTTRQATNTRRNMQVRASHRPALQPSDMCQTPERTSGMTYRISRGG